MNIGNMSHKECIRSMKEFIKPDKKIEWKMFLSTYEKEQDHNVLKKIELDIILDIMQLLKNDASVKQAFSLIDLNIGKLKEEVIIEIIKIIYDYCVLGDIFYEYAINRSDLIDVKKNINITQDETKKTHIR